jgi:Putative peptidoglycan binding domain
VPWECKTCQTKVPEDTVGTCPSCGQLKTSWTIVDGRTRTMVLGKKKKLTLLRGQGGASAAPSEPPFATDELVPAEVAVVLAASELAALAERGHVPASRHVLFVRLEPGKAKDWTVTLAVDFARADLDEREFPQEGELVDGVLDARFVFYRDDGADLSGVTLPGLTLVEITEDTERGFAPGVEVSALGRPAQELPTQPAGVPLLLRLQDERSQPLIGADVEARVEAERTLVQATTDGEGLVVIELPGPVEEVTLRCQGHTLVVSPGGLDPVAELAGVHARLRNLGYAPGLLEEGASAMPYRLRRAVEEFQLEHELAVDGIPGPNTQAKLAEVHGT